MHIGQRDIAWVRVSKAAIEKASPSKTSVWCCMPSSTRTFGKILDKVEVTLYTKKAEDVDKITKGQRRVQDRRRACGEDDRRGCGDFLLLHPVPVFAPTHVCTVSPERTGLCGAYNWMDCKASYEINPTGPNQPIEKGECLDPVWAS
jgi:acetyl-CoA synthase